MVEARNTYPQRIMINLSLFYHHSAEIYHQRREISLTACISWNPAFLFGPVPCVICCQYRRNQRISKSSKNLAMFRRNRPISLRHVGMLAKPVQLSRVGVGCFSRYGVKWLGESLNNRKAKPAIRKARSQGGRRLMACPIRQLIVNRCAVFVRWATGPNRPIIDRQVVGIVRHPMEIA